MSKIYEFLVAVPVRYKILFVVILATLVRLPYFVSDTNAFSFDHGKDSLAIMHMVETFSPKLIGPWTSIPGLFFGPGWYYLMAPAYILFSGHPAGFAIWMGILYILTAGYVTWRFGVIEGVIVATGVQWIMMSQSAWNPFPVPIVMFLVLDVLRSLSKKRERFEQLPFRLVFLLGLLIGALFHFSSAFAVFAMIGFFIFVLYGKTWFINLLLYGLGVFLMFVPQLAFELRNQFVQTKAVLGFVQTRSTTGQEKISIPFQEILRVSWGEIRLSFLPEFFSPALSESQQKLLRDLALISFLVLIAISFKNGSIFSYPVWKELVVLSVLLFAGLQYFHFNFWYVYGLFPFAVLFISHMIRKAPKWLMYIYLGSMVFTAFAHFQRHEAFAFQQAQQNRELLPIKLEVMKQIYEKADGKPFSSFHYVPDIYDFSYQYLFFWQAKSGSMLPVEFAYMPNSVPYIQEKPDLMTSFSSQVSNQDPELIFFVIEKPSNPEFLLTWWGDQQYGSFIDQIEMSPQLKLYVATPPTPDQQKDPPPESF